HTRLVSDWSSDVCSSDLTGAPSEIHLSHSKSDLSDFDNFRCPTRVNPSWVGREFTASVERSNQCKRHVESRMSRSLSSGAHSRDPLAPPVYRLLSSLRGAK